MSQKKACYSATVAAMVFMVLGNITSVYGSGFGIFTQGASALGQADAVVAHTDEPSAIFFNPALINSLPGTQVEVGTTAIFPIREFTSDLSGGTVKTKDTIFFPSTFFITHSFNDKISAGLGVFNPFGLGTDWGDTWEGRYIATKSEMTTFNINPVVSYRITPDITLAAGLDILLLDATFKSKVNLTAATGGTFGQLPDAGQKFRGDGIGIGYNLGTLINITKDVSFGASYRSEVKIDVKGDASFDTPILTGANAKTEITLPQQVFAGFYYKGFDPLTVEIGMRWEGWSSFDQLRIDFDQPVGGQMSSTTPRNWKDTFSYNIGATYRLNDTFTLLGGYLYGDDPIPDSTFEPAIPDSPSHLFCVGTDMKFDKLKVAISYAYQLLEERKKNNSIGDPLAPGTGTANGTYNSSLHMVGVSLVYKF